MGATLLKQGRLETVLVGRGLEGFQHRVEVELQTSGIAELDAVLGGGFPRDLMRGVEKAIPSIVGRQTVAAESAQIHVVSRCAGAQVERDREPPRRGIRPQRSLPLVRESTPPPSVLSGGRSLKPWKRLE